MGRNKYMFHGKLNRVARAIGLFLLYAVVVSIAISCASTKDQKEIIWPLPPEEPKIRFLKSISSAADVRERTFFDAIREFLFGRMPVARLGKPYAVHMDKDGRMFVADSAWRSLLVFDTEKKEFGFMGLDGPGVLSKPRGITTDSEGRVFTTDVSQSRGVVYDREGNFQFAIGKRGRFSQPVGIAVNENLNRIYVVDTKKHNVSVFDSRNGEFLFDFGERGVEDGQFNWPTNAAIDNAGQLYVMDTFNFRVQIFGPDGGFVHAFGAAGTGLGMFAKPKGIAVDSEGHIYVVDAAFNNVQIFNQEGILLLFFGSFGSQAGQFWLPAGMHIDQDDKIYVADQYNKRINVYQYLGGVYQAKQAKQAKAEAEAAATEEPKPGSEE